VTVEQIDMAESVTLLRNALERAFPELLIEVTVDHDEVKLTWRDGPTQREVNRIACLYAAWDFGDICSEPVEHYLTREGRSLRAHGPDVFEIDPKSIPEGSRRVRFAPHYVWVNRTLSPAFRAEIVTMIEEDTGEPFDPDATIQQEVPFRGMLLRGLGAQIVWQASCYISGLSPRGSSSNRHEG
jgi:hypothetical protein